MIELYTQRARTKLHQPTTIQTDAYAERLFVAKILYREVSKKFRVKMKFLSGETKD